MLVRSSWICGVAALCLVACSDDGGGPTADLAVDSGTDMAPFDVGPSEAAPDSAPTPDGDRADSAQPAGTWTKATSPLTHTFWGVWGSGPDDVWAVGVAGKILHYSSGTWTEVPSGVTVDIRGVWGTSATDVWAAGSDGWVLHYNGTSWAKTQVGTDDYFNVGGDKTTGETWIVGDGGKILHNKGSGWVDESVSGVTSMLMGIWAQSATDVWVVGWQDTILHYDGMSWTKDPSGTGGNLEAVWATSAQDVWVVGKQSVLRRKNNAWNTEPTMGTQGMFTNWQAVGGTGASDVWVVGDDGNFLRYDGTVWADIPKVDDKNLYGLCFVSQTEAWAVGMQGTLLHYAP